MGNSRQYVVTVKVLATTMFSVKRNQGRLKNGFFVSIIALLMSFAPHALAAVATLGNVVTNTGFNNNALLLVVGDTATEASFSVNGGDWVTNIANPYGQPSPFSIDIGRYPSGSFGHVIVSGTNRDYPYLPSLVSCTSVYFGRYGGSYNSLEVTDGAFLLTSSVEDLDSNSSLYPGCQYNYIFVAGPGSLLQCDNIYLNAAHDSLVITNGAHLTGNVNVSGNEGPLLNVWIIVTGTNSMVSGGLSLGTWTTNCSVTISNGAQWITYSEGPFSFAGGANNNISIDGIGTYVNASAYGIAVSDPNDRLRISGGTPG